MHHIIKILLLSSLFAYACNQNTQERSQKEKQKKHIQQLEDSLDSAFNNPSDHSLTLYKQAVKAWEAYANKYPEDSISPRYLYKAAKGYENIKGNHQKALRYYRKLYNQYKDFEERPMVLFHIANAYDAMDDSAKAVRHYKKFLNKYPEHEFADDTKGMLRLIKMGKAKRKKLFKSSKQKRDSITQ